MAYSAVLFAAQLIRAGFGTPSPIQVVTPGGAILLGDGSGGLAGTLDLIAPTIAVGSACSMFPFLGFTSLFNFVVGLKLKMNQPVMQALNQILGPVHLVMIVLYVRAGEWIWRADDERFSLTELVRSFKEEPLREFVHHFGWAGVHALTAWLLSVPLIIPIVYYILRPILRRAAARWV